MIRAVLFDVDGTLVDSVDFHALAWQATFRHFGKEISFRKVRFQIGKGGDQLLPVFFSRQEVESSGEKMEEYRKRFFQEEYLRRVNGFPQVRELFLHILGCGQQIALASSAGADELQAYKKAANIMDLPLAGETSKDDAEKSKPHPDIFEAALGKLNHPRPEETIVVGDTPHDIEAAAKAGLRTIAVRCGGFPEASLRDAVAIYHDPADLLLHYAESPLAAM